jgi:hypothetical protein
MEAQEGEEVLLLLIHDLDTRYGWVDILSKEAKN